ncbi:N-alpha-acetyltransferase 35, NatC auxiliary subunit [Patella vulgata]|uniref:N-alpha-acetyltransferase 35, NatC auxiliary subunit n=1 Tax=Patella vulgata TaxID=6465 RepID=UPI0024A7B0DD|nr:N-alpha-acetyltransferase 35, NatC auxiliary subunit [Patella vulgata]
MSVSNSSNLTGGQINNTTVKPGYVWQDVTEDFMKASSDLDLGELLHDSSFGLFEAMSAIEMMDPKMDAGMMCNQIKRKVLTFEQAVEAGQLKVNNFTAAELIGVMDATMACLVTWLEGHSLAQTVFTNLFLHNPYIIEDRTLKAFSICMLKIVDVIRERVNRASVFEEEDFQPMSYGFKMAYDLTDVRTTGMMKEVEEELNKTLRSTRSKPGEERDSAVEQEHNLAQAVYSRVKFYRLFYSLLVIYTKEKLFQSDCIPQAQKILSQLEELITSIKATIPYGIQPAEREATKNDYPTIVGFEPLINQRLLPPTFPRYTVIKDRSEAILYVEELVHHLNIVTTLPDITSLHAILDLFMEFSKSSPCVLARSILQLAVLPTNRRVFDLLMYIMYIMFYS